jgi:hypothetical protein
MIAALASRIHHAKVLLDNHSTTILTGVGVGGTVATAVLTGRASFKAADIIEENRQILELAENLELEPLEPSRLSKTDKVKLTWKLYLPAAATGVTTITCIVVANKISSKKIAALAVASGISERALQEYKTKVVEKLGERQERAVHDEVVQQRISDNPPSSKEIILAGTGQVLCYDMTTGRYFQSTVEDIKRAENVINRELNNCMYASLSSFYDEIGLPSTSYSDSVGWNMNNPLDVVFSTAMSTDSRPCVAIDFVKQPVVNYDKLYD